MFVAAEGFDWLSGLTKAVSAQHISSQYLKVARPCDTADNSSSYLLIALSRELIGQKSGVDQCSPSTAKV